MKLLKNFILILTLGFVFVAHTQATTVELLANDNWNEFIVNDEFSTAQGVEWIDMNDSNAPGYGSALTYQFTIANGFTGHLSVVDGGVTGDNFQIFNNGQSMGFTSNTTNIIQLSNDFTANLTNANFSSGVFVLNDGTYNISGALYSTLQLFNATNGALKLHVAPVPLPGAFGLFAGGLSVLAFMRRRRV